MSIIQNKGVFYSLLVQYKFGEDYVTVDFIYSLRESVEIRIHVEYSETRHVVTHDLETVSRTDLTP